jgi:SAM-dependent methyltransferase
VRDRFIVSTVAAGGPPLASVVPGTRFAVGLDDRAVEVPRALATARLAEPGAVLDAGSALNLAVVREVVGRPAAHVTHFTLPGVNEPLLPHDEDRFTHVAGDLREMPFPDAAFDRIVCVSTLEHVGMDNSRYGGLTEHAAASATNAVRELIRVLAPAGELLITVPYGRAVDHGWFRVFDQPGLRALLEPAAPHGVTLRFFYYDDGWTEGGVEGPAAALEAGFFPDVVTGIAVARVIRNGDPL